MPVDKVKLGIDKSGNSCSYAVAQFGALVKYSKKTILKLHKISKNNLLDLTKIYGNFQL